jgi:methylglyoxal synthase
MPDFQIIIFFRTRLAASPRQRKKSALIRIIRVIRVLLTKQKETFFIFVSD